MICPSISGSETSIYHSTELEVLSGAGRERDKKVRASRLERK